MRKFFGNEISNISCYVKSKLSQITNRRKRQRKEKTRLKEIIIKKGGVLKRNENQR